MNRGAFGPAAPWSAFAALFVVGSMVMFAVGIPESISDNHFLAHAQRTRAQILQKPYSGYSCSYEVQFADRSGRVWRTLVTGASCNTPSSGHADLLYDPAHPTDARLAVDPRPSDMFLGFGWLALLAALLLAAGGAVKARRSRSRLASTARGHVF